jgi:hypothetical protein
VKCASVAYGTPGICFVALQYSTESVPVGSSTATLRFDLVEDGTVSATDDECVDCRFVDFGFITKFLFVSFVVNVSPVFLVPLSAH